MRLFNWERSIFRFHVGDLEKEIFSCRLVKTLSSSPSTDSKLFTKQPGKVCLDLKSKYINSLIEEAKRAALHCKQLKKPPSNQKCHKREQM